LIEIFVGKIEFACYRLNWKKSVWHKVVDQGREKLQAREKRIA
jgi:hypothetical protein